MLTIKGSRFDNAWRISSIFRLAAGRFKHAKLDIDEVDSNTFVVSIVSGRYRCSWCNNFREFLRNEFDVEIMEWGSCGEFGKG